MGVLFTFNERFEKRCLMNKGIIAEIFHYKSPLNVKHAKAKPLLSILPPDQTQQEKLEYVETTLLLPIFMPNKSIKGIIEISNSIHDLFSFDEEYLGIVMANLMSTYFTF